MVRQGLVVRFEKSLKAKATYDGSVSLVLKIIEIFNFFFLIT